MTPSNQNLRQYYRDLSNKMEWVTKVALECERSANCVLVWCRGYGSTKDEKSLEVLSRRTNIPKDKLFSHLTS